MDAEREERSLRRQPRDNLEQNRRQADREQGFATRVLAGRGAVRGDIAHFLCAGDEARIQLRMSVAQPVAKVALKLPPSDPLKDSSIRLTAFLAPITAASKSPRSTASRARWTTPRLRRGDHSPWAGPVASRVDHVGTTALVVVTGSTGVWSVIPHQNYDPRSSDRLSVATSLSQNPS